MQSNRRGFTLVELIVVVVILSVLSTIGFISYANYISSVRDTKRVGDLVVIHDGLQTAVTNGDLPLPDNYVTINAGGTLVGYQGYAGSGTLTIAGVQNGGMDPKNGSYYGYYLYKDRKSVQLMAWLEDSPDKIKVGERENPLVPNTYAATTPDYVNRYPKVYGRQLGILTDSLNVPVQDLMTGTLDIGVTTNTYVSYYTDTNKITGTGGVLVTSLPNASCKRIRDAGNGMGDGIYRIDPQGNGGFDVWCDMTTDGGGWTLVIKSFDDNLDFIYNSTYWTNKDLLLNESNLDISIGNSKYNSFSYIQATDKVLLKLNGITTVHTLSDSKRNKTLYELTNEVRENWNTSNDTVEKYSLTTNIWNTIRNGHEIYTCSNVGFNIGGANTNSLARVGIFTDENAGCAGPDSPEGLGLISHCDTNTKGSGRVQWCNTETDYFYGGLIFVR